MNVHRGRLTEPELERWGREVGRMAAAHDVFVCLFGELGAGKSTLARAACRGAGVEGPVPSPTFTLINRYTSSRGRPIRHADLYRIDAPSDLDGMGWQDLVQADGPVFVEWPERASERLPADRWEVLLEMVPDPERRDVTARSVGAAPPVPPLPAGRDL